VKAFIEVKRCTTALNQRHLRQVEMYAVNEGVEWLILTNGVEWQVYHLLPGLPVTIDRVLDVNLLDDSVPQSKKVDDLFYLTRESFKRHQIDDVWKASAATAPDRLAQVILSEPVLAEARKELRRRTGQSIDAADLGRVLRESVLCPDLTK
jgi:predicted type IV restriction endonuclease